jgi:hypothetical protein
VVRTLLALTLLALLSCGQQVEPRVDAGRAGAEPPASASWDWEALGPGSWSGARTTADGLLVVFVGGAEYREGDPCSVAYRAEADESADEVRLRIGAWSPPAADGQPATCNAMGHTRQVEVTLGEPLGGRKLIEEQFDRQQPVFDGATLAEVGWVPEGWRAGPEIPGSPDGPLLAPLLVPPPTGAEERQLHAHGGRLLARGRSCRRRGRALRHGRARG